MTAAAATRADASTAPSGAAMLETLSRYGRATRRELQRYLQAQPAAPYLDDLIADYPSRGGKMLRPAICIANARAFGGGEETAVRCAAAIELLHNGLLIHDDIQDGSAMRRGRPTLHALHGTALAINAGDATIFTALRPLADGLRPLGPAAAAKVLEISSVMARETAEGQALELGWRDRNVIDLTDADYFRMALKKTAWMGMIWPAQLGLVLGSAGRADPERVVRFGYFLGVAFQIEDDLRNLSVDPGYGKEMNGDLYEAKRTLMLIHVHRACSGADMVRLNGFLAQVREARSPEDVLWLAELMERLGSMRHARAVAGAMAGAAAHEFAVAYGGLPPSPDKDFLGGLVPWIFERP
jgi:geranylgeranyl diphosphate synthase type II